MLHPRYFGPNLRKHVISKLHSEVEGRVSERYGCIITVTSIEKISPGKVQEGNDILAILNAYKYQSMMKKRYGLGIV